MSPDVDDGKDWTFSTTALVIWALLVFVAGVLVCEVLMLAAVMSGGCR